ncbi:MAG: ATP synthase subunit I [Pseudomonadota bacterium]
MIKSAYEHFARACGYRALVIQLIIVGIISGLWIIFSYPQAAVSALLGGTVWFFPTMLFVLIFMLRRKERSPIQILIDFYIGEFVKLLVSFILIILVIKLYKLSIFPFLSGYLAAVLSIWILMFFELAAEKSGDR